jgi:hypothetical protein
MRKGLWFFPGLLILLIVGALWALPLGAAPSGSHGDPATITTSVAFVSPGLDPNVTVTVTDPDLNPIAYVGTGPGGEAADFAAGGVIAVAANGERVAVVGDNIGDTFTVALQGNPISTVGGQNFTPLTDRNGSGSVTTADIELVIPAAADLGAGETAIAAGDINITSILSVARGIVGIQVLNAGLDAANAVFALRYSTSTVQNSTATVEGDLPGTFLLGLVESGADTGAFSASYTAGTQDAVFVDIANVGGEQHFVLANLRAARLQTESIAPGGAVAEGAQTGEITLTNLPLSLDVDADGAFIDDITISGNVSIAVEADVNEAAGTINFTAGTGGLAAGDTFTITYRGADQAHIILDHAPVTSGAFVGSAAASDILRPDGSAADARYQINAQNAAAGTIRLGVLADVGGAGDTLSFDYSGSEQITVPATANGGEFTVTLANAPVVADTVVANGDVAALVAGDINLETGAVTFTATADLAANDTFDVTYSFLNAFNSQNAFRPGAAARPLVFISNSGSITARYNDADPLGTREARVDADVAAPALTSFSPASGSPSADTTTNLSVEIADDQSGVAAATVQVLYLVQPAGTAVPNSTAGAQVAFVDDGDANTTDLVTFANGLASFSLSNVATLQNATTDQVVFWWVTTADVAGNAVTSDADAVAGGNQPNLLTVDPSSPTLTGDVFTGEWWDSVAGVTQGDRPALVGATSRSRTNAVRVVFSEALNGATVGATDFTVDGAAVEAAHFAGAPSSVFLTLATDLAPDATPEVALVGSVSDVAGNTVSGAQVAAIITADGIAPTPTVDLSATLSTGALRVTVTTDEAIRTVRPTVAILTPAGVAAPVATVTPLGGNSWQFAYVIGTVGAYTVSVTVTDQARNVAVDATNTFEIDNGVPAPLATDPLAAATVSVQDPFIVEINWANEGGVAEYAGDTHANVTVTAVTIDGDDISDLLPDNVGRRFTLAIPLSRITTAIGAHTVTLTGTDDAGNSTGVNLAFTIVERPAWVLTLDTGWNLISFPAELASDSNTVNAVFGAEEAVTSVLTFDNGGQRWMGALRFAPGEPLEGDLVTLDAAHAYFVRTDRPVTVNVNIPSQIDPDAVLPEPPSISVVGGQWNLVPVISLEDTANIPQGTELDADTYLGAFDSAFTLSRNRWVPIGPGTDVLCETVDADFTVELQGILGLTPAEARPCGDVVFDERNAGPGGNAINLNPAADADTTDVYVVTFGEATPASLGDSVQIGRGYWVFFPRGGNLIPR